MEGVLGLPLCWFPSREVGGCRLGRRDPVHTSSERGLTAIQCGVRIEGAAATEASEVGSHRVTGGEQPPADWTGPPKRGQRRETQAPRASSEQGKTSPGWEIIGRIAGDRNVIPSGTVEHGCTRVEIVDGSSLVVRISRV
jgi:hypothetical protein